MRKKLNFKKLALLVFIPIIAIALYFYATRNKENAECSDVIIKIKHKTEKALITENDLYRYLNLSEGKKSLIGKYSSAIKMNEMEQKLLKNKSVKNAVVFMDMSGKIIIEITQRNPIVRVMPHKKIPYYLSDDGAKIPISPHYAPNLIPVTGFVNDKIDRNLCYIVGFVNNNTFWKDQIQQFFVSENQDISFIPFPGVHEVILGDTANLDEKIKKLEIFYKKGLSKIGWNKYKSINLKYKDQLICKQ